MATKKPSKEKKLSKYLKSPIKILTKARDLYIQSMAACSERVGNGTVLMGCPATTTHVYTLPKSFSVNSTKSSDADDDYKELLRVASARNLSNKIDSDLRIQRQQSRNGNYKVPRSQSVGIGRIDEEKPCEFEEDVVVKTDHLFPRSKSYAVSNRRPSMVV